MILLKYKYHLLNLSTLNIFIESDNILSETGTWTLYCKTNDTYFRFGYSSEELAQKAYDKIIDTVNRYAELGIRQDHPYIIDLNREVIEHE